MNPYAVERLAEMRHRELVALAHTDDVARRARRVTRADALVAGETVRSWRLFLGRRLVGAGLRLGLPPRRRAAAFGCAHRLLAAEELTTGGSRPGC